MKRKISLLLLLVLALAVNAQESETFSLVKAESELKILFDKLYSDSLTDYEPLLNSIQEIMLKALAIDGSIAYPWNKLDKIGVIPSGDGKLKIFTWHVMDDLDNYRYFGYIQVGLKKGHVRVFELTDNLKAQRNLRKVKQSPEDWCGKLYYEIITEVYKRTTVYTLLGMDFNNRNSTIKTIEAITLQRNKPNFTRELFFDGHDRMDRMVFEYSSQVAISVRYDQVTKKITMDHLIPFHPIYNGNYEFYGPDGSYDGLEFEAGTWIYREDIDARNFD